MPNWSRASTSRPVCSSKMANANMPRKRCSAPGPQCRHASRTTSVSELVLNLVPSAASSVRNDRKL